MYKEVSGFLGFGFQETQKPIRNPRKSNLNLRFADATHLSLGYIYGMFTESTRVIISRLQKEMRRILVVQA